VSWYGQPVGEEEGMAASRGGEQPNSQNSPQGVLQDLGGELLMDPWLAPFQGRVGASGE